MRPPPNSGGIHPDGYATDKFYPAPAPAPARDHLGQKKPVSGAYATGANVLYVARQTEKNIPIG